MIDQLLIDWLIDWCLMPTLAIFKLYHGFKGYEWVNDLAIFSNIMTRISCLLRDNEDFNMIN
jgi:hypothetical protein